MLNPIIDSNLRTNIFIENKEKNSRAIFIVRFFMTYSFLFVFAYIVSYNIIVVKKEGVLMWKKYFSKYKWTDLFWILFVILTCIYIGNRDLLPLNHQEFSLRGSFWGFVLALYQLLFIDKFIISNRKEN